MDASIQKWRAEYQTVTGTIFVVGFVLYSILGVFFSYSNGSSPAMAARHRNGRRILLLLYPIGAPLDDPVCGRKIPADQGAAHRLFPCAGLACFGRHFLQRPLWGV